MYNVIRGRVRITIVAVQTQRWTLFFLPYYLIKSTGGLLKYGFILLYTLCLNTLLILRRIQWDTINVHTSSCEVPVILVSFYSNLCFPTYFRKFSNIKFHENPSSGSPVVPCGRTDTTKLTVAFRHVANTGDSNVLVWPNKVSSRHVWNERGKARKSQSSTGRVTTENVHKM